MLGRGERGEVCGWDVAAGSLLASIEKFDNTSGSEGHVTFQVLMGRPALVEQDAGL